MGDLLVRSGRIVDGTGVQPSRVTCVSRGGVIVEVGHMLTADGDPVLDADGAYVTPGFIDVHTHYDGAMWWDRSLDPSPLHGVTTVVTGNCAISLAPVTAWPTVPRWSTCSVSSKTYPYPRSPTQCRGHGRLGPSTATPSITRGASCNIAPLVGHNNLRMTVLGEESFDREADEQERRSPERSAG